MSEPLNLDEIERDLEQTSSIEAALAWRYNTIKRLVARVRELENDYAEAVKRGNFLGGLLKGKLTVVAAAVHVAELDLTFSAQPPKRHHHIVHALASRGIRTRLDEQGFLLSDGRFVMRKAAEHVAREAGQITEIRGSVLTSEDLW